MGEAERIALQCAHVEVLSCFLSLPSNTYLLYGQSFYFFLVTSGRKLLL